MNKPLIGITIGDQAGIGPEIIEKAIPLVSDICDVTVIGERLTDVEYGKVSERCGRAAGWAIKEAVDLAIDHQIDAIVTAPINKEALKLGGWDYPGHTEMLADLTHTPKYAMMLIHKNLRVIHVTTHQSLRKALDSITIERIAETCVIARNACWDLGIRRPRTAVCALNPHGSDGGLFGDEEELIIKPAIIEASQRDCFVYSKPFPADVCFAKALGGMCDVVVAMYHDQGHIPVKTVGFTWNNDALEWASVDGVNMTCGLPIIRTSPDHGTAFGKAGKGCADPTSMINAIKIAVDLVNNKRNKPDAKAIREEIEAGSIR